MTAGDRNLASTKEITATLPLASAVKELETVLRLSPGHPEATGLLRTVTAKP